MPFLLVTDEILEEKEKFLKHIRDTGSISYPEDADYPAAYLDNGRKGMMFALLIGRTRTGEKVLLRGFSGLYGGSCTVPGYVNPCYSSREFYRITEEYDKRIKALTRRIEEGESALIGERRGLTHEALEKINGLYQFADVDGNRFPLSEIGGNLPTGTGDCAGIKVLNTALRKNLAIEGFIEFYYGRETEERKPGMIYPPCKARCEKLIARMLGLDFAYIEEDFAIVNKPSGLLSVPGRGEDKLDSVATRFRKVFPDAPEQSFVHRLDMDTSGILVLARNKEAHRKLSMAFERREVHKEYEALLQGMVEEKEGTIDLPMRLDVDNRPYQIVDHENGKSARTRFKRLEYLKVGGELVTRMRFYPETGRTHQIRVHASSGLGHPIKGDRLYGERKEGERLYLHASSISFPHPRTGEVFSFSIPVPF